MRRNLRKSRKCEGEVLRVKKRSLIELVRGAEEVVGVVH